MNSLTVNSLFQLRVVPNMCSNVSVVVVRKLRTRFCIAKKTPPIQAVMKLLIDFSCMPFNDVNHIRELRSIIILASELIPSPLKAQMKVCRKYKHISMNAMFIGSSPPISITFSNLKIVSLLHNLSTITSEA